MILMSAQYIYILLSFVTKFWATIWKIRYKINSFPLKKYTSN